MALSCVQGKGECTGCGFCGNEPRIACDICGESCIDYYYQLGENVYCEDCMNESFRKRVS